MPRLEGIIGLLLVFGCDERQEKRLRYGIFRPVVDFRRPTARFWLVYLWPRVWWGHAADYWPSRDEPAVGRDTDVCH